MAARRLIGLRPLQLALLLLLVLLRLQAADGFLLPSLGSSRCRGSTVHRGLGDGVSGSSSGGSERPGFHCPRLRPFALTRRRALDDGSDDGGDEPPRGPRRRRPTTPSSRRSSRPEGERRVLGRRGASTASVAARGAAAAAMARRRRRRRTTTTTGRCAPRRWTAHGSSPSGGQVRTAHAMALRRWGINRIT